MLTTGIVWNQFTIGVLRRFLSNGIVLSVGIVLALSVSLFSILQVTAASSDCDANAVIYCGVNSTESLTSKYNNGDGRNSAGSIQHIFSGFGISRNEISSIGSTARNGSITSDGNVHLDGKIVATNAMTAGRQNMSGSNAQTHRGTTFYTRPPSVSFASSPLEAYVVMKDGVFQFAIIKSCGNPVKANPRPRPPAPQPTPPTPAPPQPMPAPTPTPAPNVVSICSGDTANTATNSAAAQGGNCSTNTTTVNQQTAAPAARSPSGQCLNLEVQTSRDNPLEVTASVNFQELNGAKLQSVSYNFGDQTAHVSLPASQLKTTHTYAQAGTYTITATLAFNDESSQPITSVMCQSSVAVTQPPAPAAPPAPPSAPQAQEVQQQPVVTPAAAPAPTPVQQQAAPTTLVSTGSQELGIVSAFISTVLAGMFSYRLVLLHRFKG